MTFTEVMDGCARAFEACAVVVLVIGLVASFVLGGLVWHRSRSRRDAINTLREVFGGVLLLGLEILVAADLIRTLAVAPTLDNVVVLALIVLLRTFLSFSLEIEIEGVPPWRRALVSGGVRAAGASRRALGSVPD